MQGYLLKKKEKLGRWKQLYFVLKQDGGDSHLYFYEVRFLLFLINTLERFRDKYFT